MLYDTERSGEDGYTLKIITIEALAKIVTPVKTGVQRYLNLLGITGFRLSPE